MRRLRWYVYILLMWLNNENQEGNTAETESSNEERAKNYGFKSENKPPPVQELKPFENDLFKLIKNVKFVTSKMNYSHLPNKQGGQIIGVSGNFGKIE